MPCCLEPFEQDCIGLSPVQCCVKSIKAKFRRVVFLQCCLEPLSQHWVGFSAEQCCPKSIKAAFDRIFSYAKLSGTSRTTLHRVFTCAMLFGASLTTLHRCYYLCNIVPRVSPGTSSHSKDLMECCAWGSRNHRIRKNLIKCCLNTLRATTE